MRLLPRTQPLPRAPVPSAAAVGSSTPVFSASSVTTVTHSSGASKGQQNESRCLPASPPLCSKAGHTIPEALWELALDAQRVQFVPPSTAWHRPFGLTNLSAQSMTPGGRFDTILAARLRGYSIDDPETMQSQAALAAVVARVAAADVTELHRAIGQLVVGAFFL